VIRRLRNRIYDWLISLLIGDDTTWLTDEYAALLDEQDQGGEAWTAHDSDNARTAYEAWREDA
jgi:hypothetical protein